MVGTQPYVMRKQTSLSGNVYLFLQLPAGSRLKGCRALNTVTLFQKIVLYTVPNSNVPGDSISNNFPGEASILDDGQQGSQYTPVKWQGDLLLASDNTAICAAFQNVAANDILELHAEVQNDN